MPNRFLSCFIEVEISASYTYILVNWSTSQYSHPHYFYAILVANQVYSERLKVQGDKKYAKIQHLPPSTEFNVTYARILVYNGTMDAKLPIVQTIRTLKMRTQVFYPYIVFGEPLEK